MTIAATTPPTSKSPGNRARAAPTPAAQPPQPKGGQPQPQTCPRPRPVLSFGLQVTGGRRPSPAKIEDGALDPVKF